jgi:hypothetical protein
MRAGTDNLKEVLAGSFSQRFFCDIYYGPGRTIPKLPIVNPQFKWNLEANIIGSGSVMVEYTPEFAESMAPKDFVDFLAPFGAQAASYAEITAGGFSETIQLDRYAITAAPTARDEFMDFMGQTLVSGSTVELTLLDLSVKVDRWGFRVPETPPSSASCFDELGRITGARLLRNVPDLPIPTDVVYEANQGGRWKAVGALAGVLGGRPYFNSSGALTIIPDVPGDVVVDLVIGDRGTIMDVDTSMDSEGVYNEVVGNFEDDNRNPIYSVAAITSGRLDVNGEYGHYTYYASSPLVKTQAAADAFVRTRLFNLSSQQTYRVPIQCLYNPLVEVGDTARVARPDRTLTGRVMSVSNGADGLMSLELEVARSIA